MSDATPWEGQCLEAASTFAQRCRALARSNPHDLIALDAIINTLMTELWDNNFGQAEIRSAFEQAVADMPRYAAGVERRNDNAE